MQTKEDFQNAIRDAIPDYPTIAPLYKAGDPRIIQHLDAMATMLSLLSGQIEVAMTEPFAKARDSTVLADSAMRGIVRRGTPARVRVLATNRGVLDYVVDTARNIVDSAGLTYRIETAATVPAGGTATFEAVQLRTSSVSHTVDNSEPFYSIEVPAATDDTYLCGIAVNDDDGELTYRDSYLNVAVGERVYHVECDDRQRVWVRFGWSGVVGVQPVNGAQITLSLSYTSGAVNPAYGSPFAFEYIGAPEESNIVITMDALLVAGQDQPTMEILRDMARYPSVYNANAVYLGEFDFLVRRNFQSLRFLNVWNESAEEVARGASYDNINAIFVACLSATGSEAVLTEPDPEKPIAPRFIDDDELTATQLAIKAAILNADDSYRVRFVTPVRSAIVISITATVASSYVASDVRQAIIEAVLNEYGETAAASRRGHNRPLYKHVYRLLRTRIQALSDESFSDMSVSISEPEAVSVRPELWRFVSSDSISVTVGTDNTVMRWGG